MLAEGTLKTVTALTNRFKYNLAKPVIENVGFKLHYQATVSLLMSFVILVCAREYFGDHIKCVADKSVPENVVETYCFFMATFTIDKYYDEEQIQNGLIPHPGVGPYNKTDKTKVHKYYQWVPFVLFIQCICFYMPHYIWKKKEGGRIKLLGEGLQHAAMARDEELKCKTVTIPSKQAVANKIECVKKDVLLRLKLTRTWSIWLVAMEITNLVHIILEIWIVDLFLNNRFFTLGLDVIGFTDWEKKITPLESVFPKVTKCTFHKYGPSGTIENHDALCVMGLNVIYEKLYVGLWFWFLFLFITSVLAVVWRIASFFLYRHSLWFNEMMFQKASSARLERRDVLQVVDGCQFGDWLFLYYLAKNMRASVYQELFTRIAEELRKGNNVLDDTNIDECQEPLKPSEKKMLDAYPTLGFNDEMMGKKKPF